MLSQLKEPLVQVEHKLGVGVVKKSPKFSPPTTGLLFLMSTGGEWSTLLLHDDPVRAARTPTNHAAGLIRSSDAKSMSSLGHEKTLPTFLPPISISVYRRPSNKQLTFH